MNDSMRQLIEVGGLAEYLKAHLRQWVSALADAPAKSGPILSDTEKHTAFGFP
jgi:hypothetical protein